MVRRNEQQVRFFPYEEMPGRFKEKNYAEAKRQQGQRPLAVRPPEMRYDPAAFYYEPCPRSTRRVPTGRRGISLAVRPVLAPHSMMDGAQGRSAVAGSRLSREQDVVLQHQELLWKKRVMQSHVDRKKLNRGNKADILKSANTVKMVQQYQRRAGRNVQWTVGAIEVFTDRINELCAKHLENASLLTKNRKKVTLTGNDIQTVSELLEKKDLS